MEQQTDSTALTALLGLWDQVVSEIRSAWRFRWYGVAAAWAIFVAGWAWVAVQPNIYEARARVYVDATSVLRPILNNQIVPPDVTTQLRYVRQSLLGRENLERVAEFNGLDVGVRTPAERQVMINRLRQNIYISGQDASTTVYVIGYYDRDRERAVGVVSTLLTSLVEDTRGATQEGVDTTNRFLDERIAEYEERLQRAEQALADFKKRNADRLPGSQGGYFDRMADAMNALEKAEEALRLAELHREEVRAQLSSENPVMPGGLAEPPPNSVDARIRNYQAELDALLLRYTDSHPDVMSVREALARLEEQRAEQLRRLGLDDRGQELSQLDANPAYQALRIALNEANLEVASRNAEVGERRAEVAALQALIDEVPDVEAELARLNRDYDVVYERYQNIVRSRETQDLSQKAVDADDVDFEIIDPPLASFDPVAPNRLLYLAAVFIAALGSGGAICWLFAQLKPVFTTATKLRGACGLPVIGVVSEAATDRERIRRRLSMVAFAGAMSVLIGLFGVALVIEVVGPGTLAILSLA